MSAEPGLLDANVLVYAVNADAPQHRASRVLLDEVRSSSAALYVTSQILCEFYSVVTNPRRVATPLPSAQAVHFISALLSLSEITVLPSPASAVTALIELLNRHPVTGGDVFDLQIVAAMHANGVERIYTFNARDFEVFQDLIVVIPSV